MRTDLLILGAGPAGCLAAIAAANAAKQAATPIDIVLVDKAPGERHRVGEILLTQTMLELETHGIAEAVARAGAERGWGRKFGFSFVHGRDRTPWLVANNDPAVIDRDSSYPPAFTTPDGTWYTHMVPRHQFDAVLREIAIERGVTFLAGEVSRARILGEGHESLVRRVTVAARDAETAEIVITPHQVIDATGQYAFLSRTMRTRRKVGLRPLSARYSYFRGINYDRAAAQGFYAQGANILSYQHGWSWIAHLGGDVTSIGIVSDDWEGGFFERLKHLPEAAAFGIANAEVVDFRGAPAAPDTHYIHPAYSYESAVAYGRNWCAVGDAARFLDPLLSQGVTMAIAFGGLAGTYAGEMLTGQRGEEPATLYRGLHAAYDAEFEILKHIVRLWYLPEEQRSPEEWMAAAADIERIFGRPISGDVQSLRWVANMENLHYLTRGGGEGEGEILKKLRGLDQAG